VLRETGLSNFFGCVNAGGDLVTKKPHKANLMACVNHFDTSFDQIYLVGDSSVDQNLALNSEAKFIFYASGYNDGINLKEVGLVIHKHPEILSII
jgi:phosphoglycolate phosphatase